MRDQEKMELVEKFEKWDDTACFTEEGVELNEYYGPRRERSEAFIAFASGYLLAKREGEE